jgi:hypothetical protein
MTDELSPEARELVEATRDGDLPSEADRERLRGKVASAIGVAGAAGTLGAASKAGAGTGAASTTTGSMAAAGSTGTASAAGAAASAKLAWLLAGAVAVGGGVALVRGPAPSGAGGDARVGTSTGDRNAAAEALPQPTPAARPQPTPLDGEVGPDPVQAAGDERAGRSPVPGLDGTEPAPARPAEGASEPAAAAQLTPRRPPDARPDEAASRPAPSARPAPLHVDNPNAASIQAELTLVGAAQYHLREGKPAEALELLDRHRGRFPNGALVQERVAARAMALCALNRHADARSELRSLESNAPGSPLLARVRAACAKDSAR